MPAAMKPSLLGKPLFSAGLNGSLPERNPELA
jgi:hypothetical protein